MVEFTGSYYNMQMIRSVVLSIFNCEDVMNGFLMWLEILALL